MKLKHKIISILGFCSFGIYMSSCLDNEKYPELHSTMGTITDIENSIIESDSYGKLIPTNPNVIKMYEADSLGQRVLISISFPNSEEDVKKDESGKQVTIYEFDLNISANCDNPLCNNDCVVLFTRRRPPLEASSISDLQYRHRSQTLYIHCAIDDIFPVREN